MSGELPLIMVRDNDELYRRVVDHQIDSEGRVNSSAFKTGKTYDTAISVELAKLTTLEECINRPPKRIYGVATVVARVPRTIGFAVLHRPELDNYSHAQIEGENDRTRSRLLAEQMRILVPPPQRPR